MMFAVVEVVKYRPWCVFVLLKFVRYKICEESVRYMPCCVFVVKVGDCTVVLFSYM